MNEKLAKKRRVRLKKLQAQQKKTKDDLESKIKQSTNTQDLQVSNYISRLDMVNATGKEELSGNGSEFVIA